MGLRVMRSWLKSATGWVGVVGEGHGCGAAVDRCSLGDLISPRINGLACLGSAKCDNGDPRRT
jgi:hypothetical protein